MAHKGCLAAAAAAAAADDDDDNEKRSRVEASVGENRRKRNRAV
jgi:hypothetical protein